MTGEVTLTKHEQQCSVKMSMNAKGLISGEVKVYADSEIIAFERAMIVIGKIEEKIKPQL